MGERGDIRDRAKEKGSEGMGQASIRGEGTGEGGARKDTGRVVEGGGAREDYCIESCHMQQLFHPMTLLV